MTDKQMLIGSLSNDLFRVASLRQRGADEAASRFLKEAKRWAEPLQKQNVADYIAKIAKDILFLSEDNLSIAEAEKCLMYGVLLQNYALHNVDAK